MFIAYRFRYTYSSKVENYLYIDIQHSTTNSPRSHHPKTL